MKKLLLFVLFVAVNTILLYLARSLSPLNYVLGNANLSMYQSALMAGLVWTLIVWLAVYIGEFVKLDKKGYSVMGAYYIFANFVGLWITTRVPFISGFGVTRFTWILIISVVATFAQWGVWILVEKYVKEKSN